MSEEIMDSDNEKDIDEDCKKISLMFVDSLFNKINKEINEIRDPLNSKAKDFFLKKPKKTIQEQLKPSIKTNSQKDKKTITNYKNKNASVGKAPIHKKTDYNNRNNSRTKIFNSSSKNLKNNNKDSNSNISKINIRDLNKRKKTYVLMNKNYKAKKESEKEKKMYQEKVKLLENRIIALKKHENDIHKRMHYIDLKQTYLEKRKKEKNDMKQALLSYDIEKRNELELKRKTIKNKKYNLDKQLKESLEKTKLNKMKNYENLKKEKKLLLSKINENNNKIEEYGKVTVNKIKKEREQIKRNEKKKLKILGKSVDNYYLGTCQDNVQETNKLKDKLKNLEKLETKYLYKLNETRKSFIKNNSEGVCFFKIKMSPLKKLDLDKYLEIMPLNGKEINKKKRIPKTTSSLDTHKNIHDKKSNNSFNGNVIK